MSRPVWRFLGRIPESDAFACDHYLFTNGSALRLITVADFWTGSPVRT